METRILGRTRLGQEDTMQHPTGLETIGEEAYSLLSQFYQYDPDVPLDPKVYDREDSEASFREKIVFRGARGSRVPAYLAVPTTSTPPYPTVFILHGLGTSKEDCWTTASDRDRLARELLSAGFAICTLDVPYHGERAHQVDYESAWSVIAVHGRVNHYREMLVESVLEHRRAMDYLTTRPEIDVSRFGILGRSVGGLVTYILTAVDARIKAAIAASTLPMSDYYVSRVGWDRIAKDRLAPVAPRNFAPAIKHAALLMLNGSRDQWGTPEDLRSLYALIGSPSKELVFFDSDHALPPEYVPRAIDWFCRHLG